MRTAHTLPCGLRLALTDNTHRRSDSRIRRPSARAAWGGSSMMEHGFSPCGETSDTSIQPTQLHTADDLIIFYWVKIQPMLTYKNETKKYSLFLYVLWSVLLVIWFISNILHDLSYWKKFIYFTKKYTEKIILGIYIALSIGLFSILVQVLDKKKDRLDTFIVVISLISLIINNTFKNFNNIEGVYNKLLSNILRRFSEIFILVILFGSITTTPLYDENNGHFYAHILILLYGTAIIIYLISKFLLIKNKESIAYAIWWFYILILYIYSI